MNGFSYHVADAQNCTIEIFVKGSGLIKSMGITEYFVVGGSMSSSSSNGILFLYFFCWNIRNPVT